MNIAEWFGGSLPDWLSPNGVRQWFISWLGPEYGPLALKATIVILLTGLVVWLIVLPILRALKGQ